MWAGLIGTSILGPLIAEHQDFRIVLYDFNMMARHRIITDQCVIISTKYYHIGRLLKRIISQDLQTLV